jgi:hypothetical protein
MKKASKNRLFYKPDDTFKEDLVKGYFGMRVVESILCSEYGHELIPLEEWGESVEIVKDVEVKRHRKTDLICKKCGMRIEVRAKTQDIIAMSDSEQRPFEKEHEDDDWVAFPIFKTTITDRKEVNFEFQFTKKFELQKIYFVRVRELKRTKNQAKRKRSRRGETFLVWKEGDRYNVLAEFLTVEAINNKICPHYPSLKCGLNFS